MSHGANKEATADRRVSAYLGLAVTISLVNDGWSGRPSPLVHQVVLIPFSVAFTILLWRLLAYESKCAVVDLPAVRARATARLILVVCISEFLSILGFIYEGRHFSRFGYAIGDGAAVCTGAAVVVAMTLILWRKSGPKVLAGILLAYGSGTLLAIRCFPLNYLRSDMLPVILWADQRLVAHANPYATMHVGSRLYDFPYLPGMLVAFTPAVAAHLDVRCITLVCALGVAGSIYFAAAEQFRLESALLLGVFLLSPFLQYRHDLYLAPHWLALTISVVLMQRHRFAWAAVTFGLSMALYQLSWVLFPFLFLYAHRRRGWSEVFKTTLLSFGAMLLVVGPFLSSAAKRIESNTVGQWSRLPHALADPINLSYWSTFLVRPDELKWVQLTILTFVFGVCVLRNRCRTLLDTLRWMSVALAIFIAMNVIVDGYFYLTLLLVLLMYTCVATGIWPTYDEVSEMSMGS